MTTIYLEAQTGIVREAPPENSNYYQLPLPSNVIPLLVNDATPLQILLRASENYVSRGQVSLQDFDIPKEAEELFNNFLVHVNGLVGNFGIRNMLKALCIINENKALIADHNTKSDMAWRLTKLLNNCLERIETGDY